MPRGHKTYFRQRPVKGGRAYLGAAFISETEECIEAAQIEFNVTRSWIIAFAVGKFFGVKEQEDPRVARKRRQK